MAVAPPATVADPAAAAAATAPPAHTLLVVLLGLPAAGKTTMASTLCRAAAEQGVQAHHICLDDLLAVKQQQQQQQQQRSHNPLPAQQQPSGFSADAWQACRRQLLEQVQQLLEQQQQQHDHATPAQQQQQQDQATPDQQQQQQQLILVDDNNYYQSMRYQFLQLARAHGAAFLQLHLCCPLEVCLQRNRQRRGAARVPDSVLAHCAAAFEPPDPARRPWEARHTLVLMGEPEQLGQDGNSSSSEQLVLELTQLLDSSRSRLWECLLQHWGPAVPLLPDPTEVEAVRAAAAATNLDSRVHQADLASRAVLNAALGSVKQGNKAAVAKSLNDARKQMLSRLRAQVIATGGAATGSDGAAHNSSSSSSQALCVEELLQGFQYMCSSLCAEGGSSSGSGTAT